MKGSTKKNRSVATPVFFMTFSSAMKGFIKH